VAGGAEPCPMAEADGGVRCGGDLGTVPGRPLVPAVLGAAPGVPGPAPTPVTCSPAVAGGSANHAAPFSGGRKRSGVVWRLLDGDGRMLLPLASLAAALNATAAAAAAATCTDA